MAHRFENHINSLADSIIKDYNGGKVIDEVKPFDLPDKAVVTDIIYKLRDLVYPGFFKTEFYNVYTMRNKVLMLIEDIIYKLRKQIKTAIHYIPEYMNAEEKTISEKAEELTFAFLERIPKIREYIETDVQAAYEGDPAAFNRDEIIFSYPGFYAIMVNRIAHELYNLEVPMIPRIMTEHAHSRTGVDIHPGAKIGEYFFIDHGTGVVIGETTVIGNHVKLYQGVTLGGLSTRGGQSLRGVRRHPTIGDNVTIYSNASILGGETIIGDGCIISGNCFITASVPPGMRVSNAKGELQIIPDTKTK